MKLLKCGVLVSFIFLIKASQASIVTVEEPGEAPVFLTTSSTSSSYIDLILSDYHGDDATDVPLDYNRQATGVLFPLASRTPESGIPDSVVTILDKQPAEHNDYDRHQGKIIPLSDINEAAPKSSFAWRTAKSAGKGLVTGAKYLSLQAVRLGCGAASAYYLSPVANFYLATTAEAILMSTGASPIVTKMVYVFAVTTIYPYTVALIYYAGTKAPEILYYTTKGGKAVIMGTVSLTEKTKSAAKYTWQALLRSWKDKKYRIDATEMLEYKSSIVKPGLPSGFVLN